MDPRNRSSARLGRFLAGPSNFVQNRAAGERNLTRPENLTNGLFIPLAVPRYKTHHYPLMKSIENGDGQRSAR